MEYQIKNEKTTFSKEYKSYLNHNIENELNKLNLDLKDFKSNWLSMHPKEKVLFNFTNKKLKHYGHFKYKKDNLTAFLMINFYKTIDVNNLIEEE